jgi:hypothetical protein
LGTPRTRNECPHPACSHNDPMQSSLRKIYQSTNAFTRGPPVKQQPMDNRLVRRLGSCQD